MAKESKRSRFRGKCKAIAAGFGEAFFMHGQSAAFVEALQGQSIVAVATR